MKKPWIAAFALMGGLASGPAQGAPAVVALARQGHLLIGPAG